jgi:hypothetical protein
MTPAGGGSSRRTGLAAQMIRTTGAARCRHRILLRGGQGPWKPKSISCRAASRWHRSMKQRLSDVLIMPASSSSIVSRSRLSARSTPKPRSLTMTQKAPRPYVSSWFSSSSMISSCRAVRRSRRFGCSCVTPTLTTLVSLSEVVSRRVSTVVSGIVGGNPADWSAASPRSGVLESRTLVCVISVLW